MNTANDWGGGSCDRSGSVLEVLRELFDAYIGDNRILITADKWRLDSGIIGDETYCEIQVRPSKATAAQMSIILWQSGDVLVTVGRNGARVELSPDDGDELLPSLVQIAGCLKLGHIIERLEIDDDQQILAVATTLFDKSNEVVLDLEHFEGGKGERTVVALYEPY